MLAVAVATSCPINELRYLAHGSLLGMSRLYVGIIVNSQYVLWIMSDYLGIVLELESRLTLVLACSTRHLIFVYNGGR
jgi:hypothetical protein